MSWQLASLSVAISAHESGRHLARHVHPDEPFFVLNDTAWELVHKLKMSEAQNYLINRANKGFNGAMIVLAAEQDGLSIPNNEGHLPFHKSASDETKLDIDLPNLAYFSYVDRLIPFAASLGITLWLIPTWGRYITGGLQGGPVVFDQQNARSYGRFLGHRYPFHPWIVGGDTNRYWNPDTVACLDRGEDVTKLQVIDYEPVFSAMVTGLKEGEEQAIMELDQVNRAKAAQYETFITYHSTQGWLPHAPAPSMASAQFPGVNWLTLDCVQSGHCDFPHKVPNWYSTSSYIPVRTMYNTLRPDGKPRPVIDLEGHYESTHHAFDPTRPVWGGSDIRNGAYQAIFAGSCGYVYGVNSIWRMWDPSRPGWPPSTTTFDSATAEWYLELDLPGAYYAAILKRIMLDLPNFHARRPDNSFIQSDTREPADGSPAGSELISGMSAPGWAMVHLPFGGSVTIDITLALPGAATFRGWWIDPRVGSKVIAIHTSPVNASWDFEAPTGGSIDDDWLLYLESSKFSS